MKVNFRIYFWLAALSLVITGVFLALMPDTVPMHYNAAGVADRFGSKFENLLFPLCVAVTALLFAAMAKRPQAGDADRKIVYYAGLVTLVFFNVMFTYFLWVALTYDSAAPMTMDVNRFAAIAIGVTMLVLGNIMPKARRNAFFGLRTPWTMSSDSVWQKSQRFGGFSCVAAGALLCLLGGICKGETALWASLGVIAVWAAASTGVSWYYYRQEQTKK